MPEMSPMVNVRSVVRASRVCSDVTCMVVPLGMLLDVRRSRTTYRPTVTSQRSTIVNFFTVSPPEIPIRTPLMVSARRSLRHVLAERIRLVDAVHEATELSSKLSAVLKHRRAVTRPRG